MPFAALIGAVAGPVIGGLIGSDAASSAADAQSASAAEDRALQREIFDKQVALQEPFRQVGLTATNRLAYLLGLSPTGYGNGGYSGAGSSETRDQIRARLLPQYTKSSQGNPIYGQGEPGIDQITGYSGNGQPVVDEAGLNAAVQSVLDQQQRSSNGGGNPLFNTLAGNDPDYGSLMRDFSMSDFEKDPGYSFRLDEGLKALSRKNAAIGMLGSGRAMKDITRYAQGLASDEYSKAFDRYQVNRSNKLQPLQSLAGVGQSATNVLGQAAQNYGVGASSAINAGGNARAAGAIGQGNALTGALSGGWNNYQTNKLYDAYINRLGGGGGNPYQAAFSNTSLGSSGFGTGLAYGNQDYGQYL